MDYICQIGPQVFNENCWFFFNFFILQLGYLVFILAAHNGSYI